MDQEIADHIEDLEAQVEELDATRRAKDGKAVVDAQKRLFAVQGQIIQVTQQAREIMDDEDDGKPSSRRTTRGAETTGVVAKIHTQMAQVPIAYCHLLNADSHPLVRCTVRNVGNSTRRMRVITFIEGYTSQDIESFELPAKESIETIHLPTFFPERTNAIRELTRAMLNVLIEDLDSRKVEIHQTQPVWLLARNSAPLRVRNPNTNKWTDLSRYFGAFVTPHQEEVEAFLSDAVTEEFRRTFSGYQVGVVTSQVEAIYNALRKRRIRYVDSSIDFAPEQGAGTQRVRLPRETLKHNQANCIDGTLLMASLLEAIGINPAIVIVPGHALLGWSTAKPTGAPGTENQDNDWDYLETTYLGMDHDFEQARETGRERARAALEQQREADADPDRQGEVWFRRWSLRELPRQIRHYAHGMIDYDSIRLEANMEDFDLRISEHDGYTVRVSVIQSKAGNVAPVEVEIPYHAAPDLVDEHDTGIRAIAAEFTAQVMPETVWQAWRESWAAAGEHGIRLRIRCEDAESIHFPWELLYDAERSYFLAQDPRSSVVRYLEGPIPDTAKPIEGPLRILLTGASPADQDELEIAKELGGIESALSEAQQAGRVEITRVNDLTVDTFDRTLLEVKPHVFHFSGHGVWNEVGNTGYLVLDSGAGETAALADNMLAMLLRNRGVVLVVLNACETALGGGAWAGLAQSLVLAGVPAVVAMQMPVTDVAATAFARTLYAALGNEYSLEQAVTLARQTIARLPEGIAGSGEWLAPTLFMRTGSEQFWLHAQTATKPADAGGFFINQVNAVNVAETQFIDQSRAESTVGDKMVDTGGGTYVSGDANTRGDFVGRDRIDYGSSRSAPDAGKAFTKLAASVALRASTADVGKATELVGNMQQAFTQGDDDKLADCIGDLSDLVPDVKDTLMQALSQPPLNEHVGPAAKYALRRLG